MPYHLEKVGRKYQVITTATGAPHSKAPMSKKKAEEQLRILNAHTDVVEHVGGAFGVPVTYVRNRSAEDRQKEQEMAETSTGLITGTVGSLLTVAKLISAQPGTENFFRKLGIETSAMRAERRAEEDARRFEEILNQPATIKLMEDLEKKNEAEAYAQALVLERSGVNRVYTTKELEDAAKLRKDNEENQRLGSLLYSLERKQLKEQLDAERIAKQRQALQEQQQQHLSGLNERSRALQAQITNAREAAQKSRILQQQRYQDQKLFLTKVNDIKRQDFFSQDRALREARQATIEAEQRRQAIKAAAASAAIPAPAPAPGAPQMIPTLGRRLPPSVLWHQ